MKSMAPHAEVLCFAAAVLAMPSTMRGCFCCRKQILELYQTRLTIENAGLVGLYKGSCAGKRLDAAVSRVPRCHTRAACCIGKAAPACRMRPSEVRAWAPAVPHRRPWHTCTDVLAESELCLCK